MSWVRVSLAAGAEDVERVCDAMESLGAVAVSTRPSFGYALIEPGPGEQPLAPQNLVTGLFHGDCDGAALRDALHRAVSPHCRAEASIGVLEDADWEHAWRQEAEPRSFGNGLWVLPTDAATPRGARTVVRLDPGLAFGTGAHPSTALCLSWLAGRALRGRTVIDYGCGSGILAVAAALLGAERVWVWDHDPQALAATRANAARNRVAQRIEPCATPPPADVLVANILANALASLAGRFAALIRPGGHLALSGIVSGQDVELARCYEADFALEPPLARDGWLLVHGTRRL